VGAPEEIEMDSVEVNIFENPHYSFDPPTAPTESSANEIESATEFSAALSHFPE
jgi:hypothetical protein